MGWGRMWLAKYKFCSGQVSCVLSWWWGQQKALVRGRSEAEATVGLGYYCDGCGRRIDNEPRGINWAGNKRERERIGGVNNSSLRGRDSA